MEDLELLEKVRRIEITAKQAVLDLFSGLYLSRFRGPGIELDEIREFQPGDDIRQISWTKTAEFGRPFVKTFREERDLTLMLLVDVSASCDFGSHYDTVREKIAEASALLAFSAIQNHDRVGLILFSDHVEKYVPPRRGASHGLRIIRDLLSYKGKSRGTNIDEALRYLEEVQKKRKIVFIFSDFILKEMGRGTAIAARKDDLVFVRVRDPIFLSPPELGLVRFEEIEAGYSSYVDMSRARINEYEANLKRGDKSFMDALFRTNVDLVELSTDEDVAAALHGFFTKRKKRSV